MAGVDLGGVGVIAAGGEQDGGEGNESLHS
jgi:hypothetical protein